MQPGGEGTAGAPSGGSPPGVDGGAQALLVDDEGGSVQEAAFQGDVGGRAELKGREREEGASEGPVLAEEKVPGDASQESKGDDGDDQPSESSARKMGVQFLVDDDEPAGGGHGRPASGGGEPRAEGKGTDQDGSATGHTPGGDTHTGTPGEPAEAGGVGKGVESETSSEELDEGSFEAYETPAQRQAMIRKFESLSGIKNLSKWALSTSDPREGSTDLGRTHNGFHGKRPRPMRGIATANKHMVMHKDGAADDDDDDNDGMDDDDDDDPPPGAKGPPPSSSSSSHNPRASASSSSHRPPPQKGPPPGAAGRVGSIAGGGGGGRPKRAKSGGGGFGERGRQIEVLKAKMNVAKAKKSLALARQKVAEADLSAEMLRLEELERKMGGKK